MTRRLERARAVADEYAARLEDWAEISQRPLFGGVGLYRDGQVFAIAWEGELYLKADEAARAEHEKAGSHPLEYVQSGKETALRSYLSLPDVVADDGDALRDWAERAWQAARVASG